MALCEIQRVLQPDEPRLVGRSLLADLVVSDLVDGLHEMAHDVELIEHQHRLWRLGLDDVDIRLPPIAADTCERRHFLLSEDVKERLDGLRGASLSAPHQLLALEVVDVGDVDVSAFSGNPLQFHGGLNQTFQEHESRLRYEGSFATPEYLMGLMFFNPQPLSRCIRSCEEPNFHSVRIEGEKPFDVW